LLPPGSDAGALLARRSACLFCILFICSIHLYATCGPCHPRYVHMAQLARGRKILTVLPPAHSLCQVCCLYRYLRFFRPLTRCASSTKRAQGGLGDGASEGYMASPRKQAHLGAKWTSIWTLGRDTRCEGRLIDSTVANVGYSIRDMVRGRAWKIFD